MDELKPPGKWPLKVLLVEDELVNRMLLANLLGRLATSVRQAGDGVEALLLIEQEAPDVVITDLSMPRLDGVGLLQEIHSRGLHPKTIVLTAHNETASFELKGAPKPPQVLFKPLRFVLLTEAIERVADELGRSRLA
jgi:CheY-like chemotaxis protein